MILRNYNPYISKKEFRRIIRILILEGQQPCMEQQNTELNIWYNHPTLPQRNCHRLGMFRTKHFCGQFMEELEEIMETVRTELGL